MAFSAAAVANHFLSLARGDGKTITPLKMQKLVYFAHGWHLALTGTPLITEPIQAWKYGPVIGSLYRQFKRFGATSIKEFALVVSQAGLVPASLDNECSDASEVTRAKAVITRVWEQYGHFSASDLTTLTHSPMSPWSKVPDKERPETPIPNDLIRQYFQDQVPGRHVNA